MSVLTDNCSPSPSKYYNTCYSNDHLIKMRDLWNIRHPDHKINSDIPYIIWKNLYDNLKHICKKESCWLKQEFLKNNLNKELLYYTFAPDKPYSWKLNPNEWLSSIDIVKVMNQYEYRWDCFKFIGPSPINFSEHISNGKCVWKELCEFSIIDQIKKGKTKIGIIFNTDPSYLPGSHWVSLFINIKKKYIYFFDSTGDKPQEEIIKLVNKIKKESKKINLKMKFIVNKTKHQKKNTECGIYALYSIIELLQDNEKLLKIKKRIKDEYIEKFRDIYYN